MTQNNVKPQSAILTRNRLQPDLVMDLPPPSQQDNVTPPLSSGSTSASSSMTSLDKQMIIDETSNGNNDEDTDETLGDHFAKQNQSTLKKNEKFAETMGKKSEKLSNEASSMISSSSSSLSSLSKTQTNTQAYGPKIEDIVLRIEETGETICDSNRLSAGSTSSLSKIEVEKSPIPLRNTQKFVSQFADLKLTGGSRTISKTSTTPTEPVMVIAQPEIKEKERSSFSFASFKPAVSLKPQILTKKKSIFLQTHSAPSSSAQGTSASENQQ